MMESIIHQIISFLTIPIHDMINHVSMIELNSTGVNMTSYNNQALMELLQN